MVYLRTGAENHRYGKPMHPNARAGIQRANAERWGDGLARFWARVDKAPGHGPAGDCWLWTGAANSGGYGVATVSGRKTTAHRLAWELANGRAMQAAHHACHSCDVRLCVNPDHIWEGTSSANVLDAKAKGVRIGRPANVNR